MSKGDQPSSEEEANTGPEGGRGLLSEAGGEEGWLDMATSMLLRGVQVVYWLGLEEDVKH